MAFSFIGGGTGENHQPAASHVFTSLAAVKATPE
jgi:hypothetical protein